MYISLKVHLFAHMCLLPISDNSNPIYHENSCIAPQLRTQVDCMNLKTHIYATCVEFLG